jgi:antitoxin VapB
MGLYVKDPATDRAVRKLAKLRDISITEAIRSAVEAELAREKEEENENEAAIDRLIEKVASWPDTGLKADKKFYDSLNDD